MQAAGKRKKTSRSLQGGDKGGSKLQRRVTEDKPYDKILLHLDPKVTNYNTSFHFVKPSVVSLYQVHTDEFISSQIFDPAYIVYRCCCRDALRALFQAFSF